MPGSTRGKKSTWWGRFFPFVIRAMTRGNKCTLTAANLLASPPSQPFAGPPLPPERAQQLARPIGQHGH